MRHIAALFCSVTFALIGISEGNASLKIYENASQVFITETDMIRQLNEADIIVLGEQHHNDLVQKGEAQIILAVGKQSPTPLSVGWEFLELQNQDSIDFAFQRYEQDLLSSDELLTELFPNTSDINAYSPYIEVLKSVKLVKGNLLGVNAPRSIKVEIRKNGLSSVDPKWIPPNFQMGSASYEKRFRDIMKHLPGHSPSDLDGFFLAHCYTDEIMAHQLLLKAREKAILITGHFHSDYSDGVVARLKERSLPNSIVKTVRIVDATGISKEDLRAELIQIGEYGEVADFIYFMNPPKDL